MREIIVGLILVIILIILTNGCATIQHEVSGEAHSYNHNDPVYIIITGNIPTTINIPGI